MTVNGHLGTNGQHAQKHVEVALKRKAEQNRWKNNMAAFALGTQQKLNPAARRSAQVKLDDSFYRIIIISFFLCIVRLCFQPLFLSFNLVDCSWSSWQAWSACTKTCGGGTKTKIRTKSVAENSYGSCSGSSTEKVACEEDVCPSKLSIIL